MEENQIELENLQKNANQRQNIKIRKNLHLMGIVLEKSGPIELAHGVELYLENSRLLTNL